MTDSYFLGCNSAFGFVSLFDELYDPYDGWTLYIIKGGPGTGKSTLMKNLALEAEKKGYNIEKIYCSSDPDSLDGVIINDLKISIADGTSPHTLEPRFAGAVEQIINLGEFWSVDRLKEERDEIIKYSTLISAQHGKCIRYLRAAQLIQNEINREVLKYTDIDKIERYIKREMRKTEGENEKRGFKVKNRIIDAATPDGIKVLKTPIINHSEDITVLSDKYAVIAPMIIERLSKLITAQRTDIIKCKSFLNPESRTSHIIMPEHKTAYITETYGEKFESSKRKINTARFLDKSIGIDEQNINTAVKARDAAIKEAVKHLKTAKELHDILEEFYIKAMNYDKMNEYTEDFVKEVIDK